MVRGRLIVRSTLSCEVYLWSVVHVRIRGPRIVRGTPVSLVSTCTPGFTCGSWVHLWIWVPKSEVPWCSGVHRHLRGSSIVHGSTVGPCPPVFRGLLVLQVPPVVQNPFVVIGPPMGMGSMFGPALVRSRRVVRSPPMDPWPTCSPGFTGDSGVQFWSEDFLWTRGPPVN